MRRVGSAAALALAGLALAVGCGGEADRDRGGASVDVSVVERAPERARQAGTVQFAAEYTRRTAAKPGVVERYAVTEGAVDLASGRGRMVLDLSALAASIRAEKGPLGRPIELRWDESTVSGDVGGRTMRLQRAEARKSGGLIGRIVDEPQGVIELLGAAERARALGAAAVRGRATQRFAFVVDARRAGRAGAPAELAPAFERTLYGSELPMEAWIDADGLPRRIAYSVRMKPVRDPRSGRLVLPARTMRAEYELFGYGREVDVGPA